MEELVEALRTDPGLEHSVSWPRSGKAHCWKSFAFAVSSTSWKKPPGQCRRPTTGLELTRQAPFGRGTYPKSFGPDCCFVSH